MDTRKIDIVQHSYRILANDRDRMAELYFDALFCIAPALRPLFGDDLSAHKEHFKRTLESMVNALHRVHAVANGIEAIAANTVVFGRPEAFAHVGNALLSMVKQGLGADYTAEICEAWSEAYRMFARRMHEITAAPRSVAQSS